MRIRPFVVGRLSFQLAAGVILEADTTDEARPQR